MQLKKIKHPNLTTARKERFVHRLLKLRSILIDAPPEQYDHSLIMRRYSDGEIASGFSKTGCGTAACAVGHAVLHYTQFPGLKVEGDYHERTLSGADIPVWMLPLEGHEDYISLNQETDYYFGPFTWDYIFDMEAYNKASSKVTKFDAIKRIEDYITQVLGCKLIAA